MENERDQRDDDQDDLTEEQEVYPAANETAQEEENTLEVPDHVRAAPTPEPAVDETETASTFTEWLADEGLDPDSMSPDELFAARNQFDGVLEPGDFEGWLLEQGLNIEDMAPADIAAQKLIWDEEQSQLEEAREDVVTEERQRVLDVMQAADGFANLKPRVVDEAIKTGLTAAEATDLFEQATPPSPWRG